MVAGRGARGLLKDLRSMFREEREIRQRSVLRQTQRFPGVSSEVSLNAECGVRSVE